MAKMELNKNSKRNGYHSEAILPWFGLLLGLTFPHLASGDVLTLGYALQGESIRVDIQAAEIANEAEDEVSIAGVAEELKKDHLLNPVAPIEFGWINGPDAGRSPSGQGGPKTRPERFVQKVKARLSSLGVSPSREGGIAFDPKKDVKPGIYRQLNELYLDHSKVTWTLVRVVTNTGVRVATLMYAGLNFYQALTVGLGVFTACTVVAWNSKHLLHFEENFRLYSVFTKQKFPKLRTLLESPAVEARISKPHYYLNWGLLEVLFGTLVLFGENTARSLWGVDLDIPGLWPFLLSSTISTASQGVSDLAVAKYEHLAKRSGMDKKLLDGNLYKRLAFNSVVSVAGFTMINTSYLPIKVTGYAFLGALSVYGIAYSKYLDLKSLKKVDPCLGSLLPEESLGEALDSSLSEPTPVK